MQAARLVMARRGVARTELPSGAKLRLLQSPGSRKAKAWVGLGAGHCGEVGGAWVLLLLALLTPTLLGCDRLSSWSQPPPSPLPPPSIPRL